MLSLYPHGGLLHLCGAHTQHIPVWREMAALLGFNNYAEYSLATKMAGDTDEVMQFLEQLASHFGAGRRASVSRELTKLYEETKRGTLGELMMHFNAHPVKGELVLVIEGTGKSG